MIPELRLGKEDEIISFSGLRFSPNIHKSGKRSGVVPEIKMPDIDSGKVKSFLASLTELKDGLMKIDFGALGGINIDIKGGGASDAVERLDKILNFMESKNGILWA